MNTELLKRVRDWIAEEDRIEGLDGVRFDMDHLFLSEECVPPAARSHFCGTACCIAGATAVAALDLKGVVTHTILTDAIVGASPVGRSPCIDDFAGDQLGLDEGTRDALFYPKVEGYSFGYGDVTRPWAVAVLDHLIETGEVDWRVGMPEDVERDCRVD